MKMLNRQRNLKKGTPSTWGWGERQKAVAKYRSFSKKIHKMKLDRNHQGNKGDDSYD
jgi:hypothetical protein